MKLRTYQPDRVYSPAELAAIEASNNRTAVKQLRMILARTVSQLEYMHPAGADTLVAQAREILAMTTPSRLAGRPARRPARRHFGGRR